MRPPGEIRAALRSAAEALATVEVVDGSPCVRGPTLQELCQRACVGSLAGKRTVNNMTRAGVLRLLPARRKVAHRSRPVAEYVPAAVLPDEDAQAGASPLLQVLAAWAQG